MQTHILVHTCVSVIFADSSFARFSLVLAFFHPSNICHWLSTWLLDFLPLFIGNVLLYFIWWQFCTLGGIVNLDQNICHRKVTPVTPYLAEVWQFVTKVWHKCDTLCDTSRHSCDFIVTNNVKTKWDKKPKQNQNKRHLAVIFNDIESKVDLALLGTRQWQMSYQYRNFNLFCLFS